MIFEEMTLEIPSSRNELYKIEQFIEEICDTYNISNTYFGNISIALMEAFDNAVKHGNKNDEHKKVTIHFRAESGALIFHVKDEGDGYDYHNLPDPTDISVKETEDTGRGLFMIRALSDEIKFDGKGSEITIRFDIKGIDRQKDKSRKDHIKEYSKRTKEVGEKGIKH